MLRKSVCLFVFLIACLVALPALADETSTNGSSTDTGAKEVVAKANKARGEGKDPNIKAPADNKNDPKATPPAPAAKGGDVEVRNYTAWKVQIYYGGDYQGVVPAWGDFYILSTPGTGVLYGRADFIDGSYLTWGPQTFSCPSNGSYTWSTHP